MKEIKERTVSVDNKEHTIKEVSFDNEEILKICDLIKNKNLFYYNNSEDVYIYKDNENINVGYKIYKDFNECNFNGYNDDKLIAKLQEKQKFIERSKFPTAIVTNNGNIIGQEIPIFNSYISLDKFININDKIIPTYIYRQVINILNELYNNDIGYINIFPQNFMVERNSGHVEIVNFEWNMIKFDNILKTTKGNIFSSFNSFINNCNKQYKIDNILKESKVNDFKEAYVYALLSEEQLVKAKRYSR